MSNSKSFWAIYISVGISYLGVGLVAPLIAIVLSSQGANPSIVGLVGTTMFAAFTVSSFPVGTLTDRIGPKPVLVGGLVVYGVAILFFAMIESTLSFFVVRAVEGVGAAAISVATETMISKLSAPDERARRMSYYALSVGLGWAAGPISGALLYGLRPELPFVACFVISMAAAALAAGFIPRTASNSHRLRGLFDGLSVRLVTPVSAGALYGYLMSSLVTLFPLYLRGINVDEGQMGSVITAVIAGTLLSQVPIGRAADRFGKGRTLMVCSLILTAMFAVMPMHGDWRLFLLTGAVAGAMAGSLYPIALAIIGSTTKPERIGAATSLFSLAFGFGSLLGPAASGLAMDQLGRPWLFYLPATLTGFFVFQLAGLSIIGVRRRMKHPV